MKALQGTLLGMAIVVGGLRCIAQDKTIPIRQIERDAQLSARVAAPPGEATIGHSSAIVPGSSSSAGFVYVPRAIRTPRTMSRGFFLLNGLHLGLAVLDVEMTQHCLANHHCVEGNPLMPSSHAGQLGINFALVGYGTFISYRLKKQGSKLWVLSPAAGIAAHAVGVASGIENR
jgi:hypothetical protein